MSSHSFSLRLNSSGMSFWMSATCTLFALGPASAFLSSHSATFSLNSGFKSSSWICFCSSGLARICVI